MNLNDILSLHNKAISKIDKGDFQGAVKIAQEIKGSAPSYYASYCASGLLIDLGGILNEKGLVKEGADLLSSALNKIIKKEELRSSAYYNLANGYMALHSFRKKENPYSACFKSTELNKARENYLKALKNRTGSKVGYDVTLWVNLGNCYDDLGRVVEALECYEEALKLDPDFGMALVNKGKALIYYSDLSSEHQETFLIEGYSLLSKGIRLNVHPESIPLIKRTMRQAEQRFKDKSMLEKPLKNPGIKIKGRSNFEKFLIRFCLKNKLYLNFCNHCQRCDAAVGDPLIMKSMIVKLDKLTGNPGSDPYLQLSGYLNQIKQDYITSRFLLIQSQHKMLNLNFVDKRVRIIDTLDYSMHNIYIQLVKSAFKGFYDVLDKIACFINEYLSLGMPQDRTSFPNVWYSDFKTKAIHEKIKETNNHSLNALYDMNADFQKGQFRKLKNTRNALTHRFVNVKMMQASQTDTEMNEQELVKRTTQLAKIVRSAIIYLLHFVHIEEEKKRYEGNGPLPPLFATDLPDELKSHR